MHWIKLDISSAFERTPIYHIVSYFTSSFDLTGLLVFRLGCIHKRPLETSMLVLLAIGLNCTPAASHACPWWVCAACSINVRKTDGFDRLPLLSARPAVTFPATEHHRPLAGTKLYCLMTVAHRCEQLAQGCYTALPPSRIWTYDLLITSAMLYPLCHHTINRKKDRKTDRKTDGRHTITLCLLQPA